MIAHQWIHNKISPRVHYESVLMSATKLQELTADRHTKNFQISE